MNTKGLTIIGRGTFSACYDYSESQVLVLSNCPVKEALSLGFFPENGALNWPKVERVEFMHKGDKTLYIMPKYTKVKGVKKDLKPNDYTLYKMLKKLEFIFHGIDTKNTYDNYSVLYNLVQNADYIPDNIKTEFCKALDAVANYTSAIGFEVSPRNLALNENGDMVLLDLFFSIEQLKKNFLNK